MHVVLPMSFINNTFQEWAAAWKEQFGPTHILEAGNFKRLHLHSKGREFIISVRYANDKRFAAQKEAIRIHEKGGGRGTLKWVLPRAPGRMNYNQSIHHIMQKVRNVVSEIYKKGR